MRSADSGPRHPYAPCSLRRCPARASRHSVSSRRRSRARDRRAPSPARGSGRSATGPRPWAACSARSGWQRGARRNAGDRVRAEPRGKARRRSGSRSADGGRRTCIVPPPDAPGGGACRRRGRRGGTAPDRGRHIACPGRGPSHGGRGRRRGASRHSLYTLCGLAREEAGRSECNGRWRRARRGAGGGGDPAPSSSQGPWAARPATPVSARSGWSASLSPEPPRFGPLIAPG